LSTSYLLSGERRAGEGGRPAWLVRAYFNPWVQLIFLGPLLMAVGGLVSLSDRRLRLAAGKKAA
jgi:cytochrome c-type biogenesis protein CcmF